MRWYVMHSTVSFGRHIDLPRSDAFTVWAPTAELARDAARALGWADMLGFRFDGVVPA